MKSLTHIERSALRHGEYVGYCHGAQRIRRGGLGWETYELGSQAGRFVPATARTLDELNEQLKQKGMNNDNA